jgi:hypothetical protein
VNIRKQRFRSIVASLKVLAPGLLLVSTLFSQDANAPFKEAFDYSDNNRLGKRLSVGFPNAPTDAGKSTELTLFEESYYDVTMGAYSKRKVAIITGMGLGTSGLKLVVEDDRQIDQLKACLNKFIEANENFRAYRDVIRTKREDWMSDPRQVIGQGRPLGTVYFYPSRKDLSAEFNWDFELNRVWMSFGSRIMIDERVIPYIQHMIESLDEYRDLFGDYGSQVQKINREIDDLLGVDR